MKKVEQDILLRIEDFVRELGVLPHALLKKISSFSMQ